LGCCAQSRLRHRRIGGILGLSYWHGDFLHFRIWWAGLKPAPTGVRWVVVPNHVCGIVVLVVFWDYRIGTWIPALSCCRGGFQTRPQGDASYGDTGIIILARVFLHYRIWWAGLKPAPTGVRWGCCAQSRLRHRRNGGGFWHYHIGTGIFCIIILSGGYITRPYRGSLGCCAQSRQRYRRIGGGFGIVMPNHVYGIVVLVVFWDYRIGTGIFCIIILSGGYITRPYKGSLGLLCPITSAASSYWWYFGIIVLARGSRPYRGSLGLLCPITSAVSSYWWGIWDYRIGTWIPPLQGFVVVVVPNHVYGIVVLVVFWDYRIGTGIFCIIVL